MKAVRHSVNAARLDVLMLRITYAALPPIVATNCRHFFRKLAERSLLDVSSVLGKAHCNHHGDISPFGIRYDVGVDRVGVVNVSKPVAM
jgi:hypothetical protein